MATPAPIAALLRAPVFNLAARALLTLPFGWSGLAKLADLTGARAEAAGLGLKPAGLVVAATIGVQLVGSFLLITGRQAWLAAGALGVFTGLATLIAHPFWTIAEPIARFHAQNTFLEHLSLIGGLMVVAVLAEKGRAT